MEHYSVLMAVYHKEKPEHLRAAVESMLHQTMPPEDFVLVCDGPLTLALDAEIGRVCSLHPSLFQILRLEENRGLGYALSRGLPLCKYELVVRMDADDLSVPDRAEKQLAAMAADPEISVLGGQIAEFSGEPGAVTAYRLVPTEEEKIREFLQCRSPMNHVTVMLRKSHVLEAGGYPDVPGFEDYCLWTNLIARGYRLRNLPDVLCRVRVDHGMYARRGGLAYFQNTVRAERLLLKNRNIRPVQFCKNLMIRFCGALLVWPGLRRVLILNFLRKRSPDVLWE